ncbi:MAG TPA: 4Fe-4S binding protein [Acidimicrobiales bacterium]|nr:4Fe-4S binding protein [Acidimicrobiales bacterium]
MAIRVDDLQDRLRDPVAVAIRLRAPEREGIAERFGSSDPLPGLDIARNPRVARVLHNRKFQFLLILPNQIIFWTVIFVGLLGTAVPGLNFGAAITWYVWFCLVFVMMVVVGRAWCAMCPFGGFAEWIQRRSFFQRTQKTLGLGRKFPESLAQFGFVLPVGAFLLLTWIEEYFNIAGPGNPAATSFMVIGIVATALTFFMVFERRTFCRYICPLTSVIGTIGSMGSVAGFRTRDRDVCVSCETKDCMRGGEEGFGCPWYTWPASADSNLYCGLCTECYKSCPEDNIGLFLQKPLTSVIAPSRRRADVAWAVALLWGLVLYQQLNALAAYGTFDNWLNAHLHFAHYPNPVAYLGLIGLLTLVTAGAVRGIGALNARRDVDHSLPGNFVDKGSRFRAYFNPIAYGLIPVVGADYFARQLPKFFKSAPRVIPAAEHVFGFAGVHSSLYNARLLSDPRIIVVQVIVMALGTLGALWATWKITNRELVGISRNAVVVRATTLGLVAVCGVAAALLYVAIQAAN